MEDCAPFRRSSPIGVQGGLGAATPWIWLALHSLAVHFEMMSPLFWLLSMVGSLVLSTLGPGRGQDWKVAYILLAGKFCLGILWAILEMVISVQERFFPLVPVPVWLLFVLYITIPILRRL